jgi:hypothetical protein
MEKSPKVRLLRRDFWLLHSKRKTRPGCEFRNMGVVKAPRQLRTCALGANNKPDSASPGPTHLLLAAHVMSVMCIRLLLCIAAVAGEFGDSEGESKELNGVNYNNLESKIQRLEAENKAMRTQLVAIQKLSVPGKSSGESPEVRQDSSQRDGSYACKYGFYFQVYHMRKPVLEVVKTVRAHAGEDAPIYMVSDQGYDFSPLAERFGITFENAKDKADMHAKMTTTTTQVYLGRIRRAAESNNCEFLINLETDSPMSRKIVEEPPYDAGGVDGVRGGNHWNEALTAAGDVNGKPWSYNGWGLAGGSYLRTSAILGALQQPDVWDALEGMMKLDDRVYTWCDTTLAALLMHYGYVVKPWKDCQQRSGSEEDGKYLKENGFMNPAFWHDDKSFQAEQKISDADLPITTQDAEL